MLFSSSVKSALLCRGGQNRVTTLPTVRTTIVYKDVTMIKSDHFAYYCSTNDCTVVTFILYSAVLGQH